MKQMKFITLESGTVDQIKSALEIETELLAPHRVNLLPSRRGKWAIRRVNVKDGIDLLRLVRDGRGTAPGAHYTGLFHSDDGIVMSDTNAEIKDMLPFLEQMSGHVLVSGLGLGVAVKALLRQKKVKRVTVVEKEKDVIALIGKHWETDQCRIICADIWKWTPPKGERFDWAWHDIWIDIGEEDLPEMKQLKDRCSKWIVDHRRQFCWGEDYVRMRE